MPWFVAVPFVCFLADLSCRVHFTQYMLVIVYKGGHVKSDTTLTCRKCFLCRATVQSSSPCTFGFNILICNLGDWILYCSKLDFISFWPLTSIICVTLDSTLGKLFYNRVLFAQRHRYSDILHICCFFIRCDGGILHVPLNSPVKINVVITSVLLT